MSTKTSDYLQFHVIILLSHSVYYLLKCYSNMPFMNCRQPLFNGEAQPRFDTE